MSPLSRQNRRAVTSTTTIRCLTLNLRFGLADDGPNRWERRKAAVGALLARYPVDFFNFQEANDFQIDFIGDRLPAYACIGRRHPAPPFWQHNVLFYKREWECVQRDHFFLSPTPDIPSRLRESRWPRQCTIGHFTRQDDAAEIVCVNTHFDFKASVQVDSAERILERLAQAFPEAPTILSGDFNATPQAACYQVFTARAFRNAAPQPHVGTYHGFSGRNDGRHIDWILFRGPLRLKAYRVIETPFEGVFPSDHFPVLASFDHRSADREPPQTG